MFSRSFARLVRCAALASVLAAPSIALAADPMPAPGEAPAPATAAQKTVSGGYGAPELKLSPMASSLAILVGSQGGWVINRRFIIGGAGYGLVNDVTLDRAGAKSNVSFGYGGFRPGLMLGGPEDTLHIAGGVILGAAGTSVGAGPSAVTWVVEPDVGVDVGVARWLRIGVSAGYRFVGSADEAKLRSAQLSGPAAGIQLKFGSL